jgi:hypothetical protein
VGRMGLTAMFTATLRIATRQILQRLDQILGVEQLLVDARREHDYARLMDAIRY